MTQQDDITQRPSPFRGRNPIDGRTLYEQIRIKAYSLDWPDDAAHEAANYAVQWFGNDRCTTQQDLHLTLSEALGGD